MDRDALDSDDATIGRAGQKRLEAARLYVILGAQMPMEPWRRHVQALVRSRVDVIQLRDKQLADRRLLERAQELRLLTRDTSTLLVVNDRPDVAVLAEADGVHVGQDELPVVDVRCIVGPEMLIGVSTHSLAQARQAVGDGADYLGVGPTFPSRTKHFERFPGLDLLRQVAAEIPLPAFAIGGINLENLPAVLATGCRRVAVSSVIAAAADPTAVIRGFKTCLEQSSRSPNEDVR